MAIRRLIISCKNRGMLNAFVNGFCENRTIGGGIVTKPPTRKVNEQGDFTAVTETNIYYSGGIAKSIEVKARLGLDGRVTYKEHKHF